jgi:hypothetical protein
MANSERDRLPLRIEPRKNAQPMTRRGEKRQHADTGRGAWTVNQDKTSLHLFVDGR